MSETPVLRIQSGNPTTEEVAALVVVLSALGGDGPEPERPPRSAWSDPAVRLGGPVHRSGGWRSSALPR